MTQVTAKHSHVRKFLKLSDRVNCCHASNTFEKMSVQVHRCASINVVNFHLLFVYLNVYTLRTSGELEVIEHLKKEYSIEKVDCIKDLGPSALDQFAKQNRQICNDCKSFFGILQCTCFIDSFTHSVLNDSRTVNQKRFQLVSF